MGTVPFSLAKPSTGSDGRVLVELPLAQADQGIHFALDNGEPLAGIL